MNDIFFSLTTVGLILKKMGDYLMDYKYIIELYKDRTIEGIDNVGSHNSGTWSTDMKNSTLVTKWNNGWIDTIT